MLNSTRRIVATSVAAALVASGLAFGAGTASAAPAPAPRLTNLAHLDSLLATVTPPAASGHTTYRFGSEATLTMPWVYSNANDDGSFTNTGGGAYDASTNTYGQGAFDSDDISRAAVVYLRDWKQTHSAASRQKAYELLRATAYFQTTSGKNAGNVVLWMQPDGALNATPTPADSPNPADAGASYWLARSLWAFGEGYAAFKTADPHFASFLRARIDLGVKALDREVLSHYGQYKVADGVRVPAWLIVDGADASAEAVLGLTAYTRANPSDRAPRTAAKQLAVGISKMASGDSQTWPYGAILPWAQSRSMVHSWSSQMPAALAAASTVFGDSSLLAPAVADSTGFSTTQLASNGPDNAWYPTAIEKTQIAYGADSRLQSLLAVAAATHRGSFEQLAGLEAGWYFGANASGKPTYTPATGVTIDGVQADGTINRNSGAESTIHGLLSMLALDAHPSVAKLAQSASHVVKRSGLTTTEAETAASTTGTVVTPDSAWTGESQYGGGKYLKLEQGQTATIALATAGGTQSLEPVIYEPAGTKVVSTWTTSSGAKLGTITSGVGAQGITAASGALLPQTLARSTDATTVTVTATRGTLILDAILARPLIERAVWSAGSSAVGGSGASGAVEFVHSTSTRSHTVTLGAAGSTTAVRVYNAVGRAVLGAHVRGVAHVRLPAGGFAVAIR